MASVSSANRQEFPILSRRYPRLFTRLQKGQSSMEILLALLIPFAIRWLTEWLRRR